MIGDFGIDGADPRDVDDDDFRPIGADRVQQPVSQLLGAIGIDEADDRQDQQAVTELKDGRRQLLLDLAG